MKGFLQTLTGQIEIDGEVGDYIHQLTEENKQLRTEIRVLKLETFDLQWKLKRKWWLLWLF